MVVSKKGRLTMLCLDFVGTMNYCLLNCNILKGNVNNVLFASCWNYGLLSAK